MIYTLCVDKNLSIYNITYSNIFASQRFINARNLDTSKSATPTPFKQCNGTIAVHTSFVNIQLQNYHRTTSFLPASNEKTPKGATVGQLGTTRVFVRMVHLQQRQEVSFFGKRWENHIIAPVKTDSRDLNITMGLVAAPHPNLSFYLDGSQWREGNGTMVWHPMQPATSLSLQTPHLPSLGQCTTPLQLWDECQPHPRNGNEALVWPNWMPCYISYECCMWFVYHSHEPSKLPKVVHNLVKPHGLTSLQKWRPNSSLIIQCFCLLASANKMLNLQLNTIFHKFGICLSQELLLQISCNCRIYDKW